MGVAQKYLVVHADDAGLCASENKATIAGLQSGLITSYSMMVPCPGFQEIADFTLQNPQYDYGVHLTLTCEWRDYKFGPVLPTKEVPSLVDTNGHFFKNRTLLKEHAQPEEAYKELKTQITTVFDLGMHPSHLDAHMFSIGASPALFDVYLQLGSEFNLPVLLNNRLLEMVGLPFDEKLQRKKGYLDTVYFADFSHFEAGHLNEFYWKTLDELNPGISMFLIHPAFNNEEMQQITVDHPNFGSEWRQMDFETFSAEKTKQKLDEHSIKLISWKEINDGLLS